MTLAPPATTPSRPRFPVHRFAVVAKRLAGPLATLLISSFAVYAALSAAPGDPAIQLAGSHATPAQLAAARHELGLDDPLPVRYWHWLTGLPQGRLGTSITYRTDVADLIGPRLGTTLLLIAYAAVLIAVLGVTLGIVGGAFRRLSPFVVTLTAVGVAIPGFVAASLLVSLFALKLGWFPTTGAGSGGFGDRMWHLTLPAVALALGWSAWVAQITRTSIRTERSREHVETARGRGIAPVLVFRRHVLRNASIPITTVLGLTVAGLLAGAVVVERAFGLDGLGSLLITSVSAKDYDVVLAISLLLITSFVVVTGLVDVLHALLDPRLRTKGGKA
ncbi:ABC transporter permease [Streptomyces europaeiscabiei]|uniref:ABC transporter permease n=1 Tax=Streptomyces TaxID=1883 RepID=UPI000A388FC9|nr:MULTISPECIES: ABC transporter permease [Streptomyces]MDX3587139.1 ABC transporter permease [Streptomyces europaeiscabiei]MDX3636725.1 ABC transporter permease [Streptomyces europaeiscabiei]MDX3650302.1 ABC transporter permease [Streptomyces europaeiscabiei]WUD37874.1 ABC transporter permease [Streptomyces europaeiscabiei]